MTQPILKIEGLQKHFATTTGGAFSKVKGTVKAVDGIDLEIYAGQTIGLVVNQAAVRPRQVGPS